MNKKIITLLLAGMLVIAACTPAPEVAEEAPAVSEDAAMEKDDEAMMEESSDEGAMEKDDEAMMEESSDEGAMEKDDEAMMEEHSGEVSFANDIWPVIEKYALSAHGGSGGIFLESYEDIVAQVEPGNPEGSMLYKVLTADGVPQMPPSGPLPEETIQLFYDWIQQGALNN